jgi:hypothetical protein
LSASIHPCISAIEEQIPCHWGVGFEQAKGVKSLNTFSQAKALRVEPDDENQTGCLEKNIL